MDVTVDNAGLQDKLFPSYEDSLTGDNSSCTSSLGTSVSEMEDLFLGAEAHSFEKKKLKSRMDSMRSVVDHMRRMKSAPTTPSSTNRVLFMKRSMDDPTQCQFQISSLKSVDDVIAARECDACTLLINLGFGCSDTNQDRNEILRRFSGSDELIAQDSHVTSSPRHQLTRKPSDASPSSGGAATAPPCGDYLGEAAKKGINKAQEWLDFRQNDNHAEMIASERLEQNLTSAKLKDAMKKSASLPRLAKMRNRFTRSRQSSFEILLPHPEATAAEEEAEDQRAQGFDYSTTTTTTRRINGVVVDHQMLFPTAASNSYPPTTVVTGNLGPLPDENRRLPTPIVSQQLPSNLTARRRSSTFSLTNQKESFELDEINSNEDASETRDATLDEEEEEEEVTTAQQHENDDDENDETSSGFDEDEQQQNQVDGGETNLRRVVEKIENSCCPHHRSDDDVDDVAKVVDRNASNNNNNYLLVHADRPSQLRHRRRRLLVRLKSAPNSIKLEPGGRLLVTRHQQQQSRDPNHHPASQD